jgi:transcription initiation factor TFIID subunit TAF12
VERIIIEAVIGGKLEEVTATMKKQAVKTVITKNHTKKKNGLMMIPSKMKIKIKRLRTSLKKLRKMTAVMTTRRVRLMIRSIKIKGITRVANTMAKRGSTTQTITFQQRSQAIPRTALPNNINERNKTPKRVLRKGTV